jgi:hypothetical protein
VELHCRDALQEAGGGRRKLVKEFVEVEGGKKHDRPVLHDNHLSLSATPQS